MDKKTTAIIALIASSLLCGLPGLGGLCFSSLAFLGAFSQPQDKILIVLASSLTIAGLSLLCLILPISIGLWFWWTQRPKTVAVDRKEDIDNIVIPEDDF